MIDEMSYTPPNPAQLELLSECISACPTIALWCARVRAFGTEHVTGGYEQSDLYLLSEEIGQLFAVFAEMEKAGVLDLLSAEEGVIKKQDSMRKFLKHHRVSDKPSFPGWSDIWRDWVTFCSDFWATYSHGSRA